MKAVFISYRRKDSAYVAMMLRDRLQATLPDTQVFMDIDNLRLGHDFREQIESVVSTCDVCLAVIGQRWAGENDSGKKRIEEPDDYVRLELEAVLARDIPVAPILVDDATLPSEESLPHSLRTLRYRQAAEIRPGEYTKRDIESVVERAAALLKTESSAKPVLQTSRRNQFLPLAIGSAIALLVAFVYSASNLEDAGKTTLAPAPAAASGPGTGIAASDPLPDLNTKPKAASSPEVRALPPAPRASATVRAKQDPYALSKESNGFIGKWSYDGPAKTAGESVRRLSYDEKSGLTVIWHYGIPLLWRVKDNKFQMRHYAGAFEEEGIVQGDTITGTGRYLTKGHYGDSDYPQTWTWTMTRITREPAR